MAAHARPGTWGLGRVVSLESGQYREFLGEAGISGYFATSFGPWALGERGMVVVVVAEAVLAPWGELVPADGARL